MWFQNARAKWRRQESNKAPKTPQPGGVSGDTPVEGSTQDSVNSDGTPGGGGSEYAPTTPGSAMSVMSPDEDEDSQRGDGCPGGEIFWRQPMGPQGPPMNQDNEGEDCGDESIGDTTYEEFVLNTDFDDSKEGIKVKKEPERDEKDDDKSSVSLCPDTTASAIKQEESSETSNNLVDLKPCKKESAFASLLDMPNLLASAGRAPSTSSSTMSSNLTPPNQMNFTSSFQTMPHNQPIHMMPPHGNQQMHHHPMHVYPPPNHFQHGCFNLQPPPMSVHQTPHHFNQLWRDQMWWKYR